MSWYQARNGKTGTTGFWCAGDFLGAADVGTFSTRQQTVRKRGLLITRRQNLILTDRAAIARLAFHQ
jgi:hypothetical protein